ncbi:MAG: restriction endonuclease subunit S [Treponema sp.]|nr:restriction endonuclease subunit S [Treponema sp.]
MAQIKKDTSLRKSILQAAITGQLISDIGGESLPLAAAGKPSSATPSAGTPRNAPTETGKELLDRIIEERNNKLLAEWEEKQTDLFASNDAHSKNAKTVRSEQIRLLKKAKKPAPIVASEIDEEEIPFEIPENWCWCRIDDLFSHNTGKALNKSENKEGTELEYITTSNLYWNYFELDNLKTMLFKDSEIEKCTVQKGDLLVCEGGEVGRTAIWNFDRTICIQNHIHRLRAYEASLNKSFYYFVMFLYKEGKLIDDYAKGIGIKGLSSNALGSIIIPLPPLSVQNAIVAKLEQVLPLVDAYENALLQKEELKSALPDKVKKAILQEAITGKLTETWRKSATIKESGKQLLDRIIEERNAKALADWEETLKKNVGGKATLPSFASKTRAKKPVPVVASEIDEEEIPFEVPESWCWCHLGEIFKVTMGQSPEGSNVGEEKEGMEFHQGKIFFTDKYIATSNQKTSEITKIAEPGSILLCMRAPVGKVNITDRQICIGRGLSSIVPLGEIALEWAFHLFETLESDFIDKSTGSTFKAITGDVVKEQLIPLPPLEEQQEIVKKVEELLELCK